MSDSEGQGPLPPPYGIPGTTPLELRGSLDCWACAVLVTAQNLLVGTINAMLLVAVFSVFCLPAAAMLFYGFLCHSKFLKARGPHCVHLPNDAGSTALLVVGFALVIPLLVLALAAYCRLVRHLQLGACFVPYTKAVYRNLPAAQYYSLGCCAPRSSDSDKVWV